MKKKKSTQKKKARFTEAEDKFIRDNHQNMTDREMGESLNRSTKSICARRERLGISTRRNKPKLTSQHREAYVASLTDEERRKFFQKDIIASARYRQIMGSLSSTESEFYIEKYVDFMMDPTVETMTAMEKDALHQIIINEVRIARHMQDEYNDQRKVEDSRLDRPPISRAKEIRECQEAILKYQSSLNVERRQRLKNQSDQSITFTNLIKEMKDPAVRYRLGLEATMLKVVAEQHYNAHLGTNIMSGKDKKFDLTKNFRDGEVPAEISEEFLPTVSENAGEEAK